MEPGQPEGDKLLVSNLEGLFSITGNDCLSQCIYSDLQIDSSRRNHRSSMIVTATEDIRR